MYTLLLISSLSCNQIADIKLKIQKNKILTEAQKQEIVKELHEINPSCQSTI